MRYLIEKDGERQNVTSLDGYKGWDIVSEVENAIPDVKAERVNRKWVVPIEVQRERKWTLIKAVRDELEDSTAPTRWGDVQIDDRSKLKISGLAMLGGRVSFTMADNSVVELDPRELWQAVVAHLESVHAHARALRVKIEKAKTAAALKKIVW